MHFIMANDRQWRVLKIFWGEREELMKRVQITLADQYGGQDLAILNEMVADAELDFPGFTIIAKAVALSGPVRKHMWGIEFTVPNTGSMPEGYEMHQSEIILAGGL